MKFENVSQPVVPFRVWLHRVAQSIGISMCVMMVAFGIGVVGYHWIGKLAWVDSVLEASMILAGEGPIAPMNNTAVKLFSSAYALFSGFIAVTGMAIILTPWLHRIMHHLHAVPTDDAGE